MDTLVEDVSCVMAALDSHGAKELVNANHVFERLETISATQEKAGTELVNLVVHSFLVDLGMAPPLNAGGEDVIIVEDNIDVPRRQDVENIHAPTELEAGRVESTAIHVSDTLPDIPSRSEQKPVETIAPEDVGFTPTFAESFNEPFSPPTVNGHKSPKQNAESNGEVNLDLKLEMAQSHKTDVPDETVTTPLVDLPQLFDMQSRDSANMSPKRCSTKESNGESAIAVKKRKFSPMSSNNEVEDPFNTAFANASVSNSNQSQPTDALGFGDAEKSKKTVSSRVASLGEMFPEADPEYLWDRCEKLKNEEDFNELIVTMLSNNDYPRFSGATKLRKNVSAAAGSERDLVRSDHINLAVPRRSTVSAAAGSERDLVKSEDVQSFKFHTNASRSPTKRTFKVSSFLKAEAAISTNVSKTLSTGPSTSILKAPSFSVPEAPPVSLSKAPSASVSKAPSASVLKAPSASILKAPSASDLEAPSASTFKAPSSSLSKAPSASASTSNPSSSPLKQASSLREVMRLMEENTEAAAVPPREPWQDQLDFLVQILPDADPSYLEEKARQLFNQEDVLRNFVADAMEKKEYPSRKDWLWRQEQMALQKKYTEEFSIPNFLEVIPDPFTYFSDPKRLCSDKNQALMFLRNKYRKLRVTDITGTFNRKNFNLTLTCKELDNWTGAIMKGRRNQVDYDLTKNEGGRGINVPFLQEIAFLENEKRIVEYIDEKKRKREERFIEAKERGELLQCQCCYDDEVLLEDVRTCSEGHVFCVTCLQRSSEQRIGDGHTTFPCLADCSSEFKLQTLQEILKPTVFSRLVQRKQAEEVKAAGIEDLIQCPFCDFCNIPPKEDKVFRCLNPDCMKESCRLCKEESHVPLRCEEVERKTEVEMRTYIENKMTEALVRTCWRCQKKFVKEDGCNKMTCQCGAKMCYICRQPVQDYSHFNGQGGDAVEKCPLWSNNDELHVKAVTQMAHDARQEVLARDPNARLVHDPTAILPEVRAKAPRPAHAHGHVRIRVGHQELQLPANQHRGLQEAYQRYRDRRQMGVAREDLRDERRHLRVELEALRNVGLVADNVFAGAGPGAAALRVPPPAHAAHYPWIIRPALPALQAAAARLPPAAAAAAAAAAARMPPAAVRLERVQPAAAAPAIFEDFPLNAGAGEVFRLPYFENLMQQVAPMYPPAPRGQ